MKRTVSLALSIILSLTILAGCTAKGSYSDEIDIKEEAMASLNLGKKIEAISDSYKPIENNNPISPLIFCADPTSVEYNGRLYVYGTNDHQQYETVGKDGEQHYGFIKSLTVMSTADMVNWTYHGIIDVEAIAPWIWAAWAPTVCSRVEEDGLTHFYMYFSNSGGGVNVITSTDPVTGWTDPLGKPLIDGSNISLDECPNPFDPGVCIDENGVGWLSFGAGIGKGKDEYLPGSGRIVQLGDDMLSFASEFTEIPVPYLMEASELNYINGKYVYTYCTTWDERFKWEFTKYDVDPPSGCSMAYMTTETPLDPDSWVWEGEYFANSGNSGTGMEFANNHTHLEKFKGKWYLFHHTLVLRKAMDYEGGFRSICVEELDVDEKNVKFPMDAASYEGVAQNGTLNPFELHSGAEMASCAGIAHIETPDSEVSSISSVSTAEGAWIYLKGVDFDRVPEKLYAYLTGSGQIEVRIDTPDSKAVAGIAFENAAGDKYYAEMDKKVSGIHDVYILMSDPDIVIEGWQFK